MEKVGGYGLLYRFGGSPGPALLRALKACLAGRPVGPKGAKGVGRQSAPGKALIKLGRLGKAGHEHGKLFPCLGVVDDFKVRAVLPKGHHIFVELRGEAAV